MTLRHGLFVSGPDGGITSPQDARLALAGLIVGPGILTGFNVTGSTSGPNMRYTVSAGVVVTQRGTLAADGLYMVPNDAPFTVDSGSPAPASGTRWDLVWVRQPNAFDGGFADSDSDPVFGVTVGTAGSSPTKPYAAVPAGALVLAEVSVGTNIANASLAAITQVALAVSTRGGGARAQYQQRNATANIDNSIYTTVYNFGRDVDTIGLSYSAGVFTFPPGSAGRYEVSGRLGIEYPGGTTILCGGKIRQNSTDIATQVATPAASGSKVSFNFTPQEITVADGDTLTMQAYVGAAGGTTSIAAGYMPILRVRRVN